MKRIGIVGHFGGNEVFLDGQTVKTKYVYKALADEFGEENIQKLDTYGYKKNIISFFFKAIGLIFNSERLIMLPDENGVQVFAPLYRFFNFFLKRKLHYAVVGGWLPTFLKKKRFLSNCLRGFDGIYVETSTMKNALLEQGFENVYLMPNCKELEILKEDELVYPDGEPYRLCTFSRVMKEKGIEDAINAVKAVNEEYGRTVFTLDIYGQVDAAQIEWFDKLSATFPEYVKYGGLVPFDKSVEVLKDYYALLFPTLFFTEGVPGTIIDAYAAGVPVISAKWESFADVVEDGVSGIGYEFGNADALTNVLRELAATPNKAIELKLNCIKRCVDFLPKNVVSVLSNKLG